MAASLQYFLSGFLSVALLVKIVELRKGALRKGVLRDERTTMLSVALASFTVAALAGIPRLRRWLPFEDIPGVASILMDTGVSVSLALLAVYLWRPLRPRVPVRWWRSGLFLSACAESVLLAVLMAATPVAQRTNPLQNEYTGDWRTVSIYLIGNLFFLCCSAVSAIACVRIVKIVHGHVAIGVCVGAIGMTAYAVTCVIRLALVTTQLATNDFFTWYSVLNFVFTQAAVLASVLGLHYTAAWRASTAVRRVFQDLRAFWRIGPLWRLLTTQYPEVVLPLGRGLSERFDISYRRYRRVIECKDALLLLGADLPEGVERKLVCIGRLPN